MITVLGILIGALIVGLFWTIVYFGNRIQDLQSEVRMRSSTYRPPVYNSYCRHKSKAEEDDTEDSEETEE